MSEPDSRLVAAEVCRQVGDNHTADELLNPPTPEFCWSRGPRIGDEGRPVCFRAAGHSGSHRSHPESGFREQWGSPDLTVPECLRENYWMPEAAVT